MLLQFLKETPVPSGFGTTISVGSKGASWRHASADPPSLEVQPSADLMPFLVFGASKKVKDSSAKTISVAAQNQSYSS